MEQTTSKAQAFTPTESSQTNGRTKVIVATTVMLSFISFWRAAAIVLNDLGSSAYYVGGVAFTVVFFVIFLVSERINERRRGSAAHVEVDQFRLQTQETVSNETVEVRPGNTLCLVRDYNTLEHVKKALELTHTGKKDLVVMTVQGVKGADTGHENIGG